MWIQGRLNLCIYTSTVVLKKEANTYLSYIYYVVVQSLSCHKPHSQNIKQRQYCNQFNTLQNGPHQEKNLSKTKKNPSKYQLHDNQTCPRKVTIPELCVMA